MLTLLRGLFAVILASMLVATSWATSQCPLFDVPRDVALHPWFLATLLDAYWGFITFFVWVCYKHTAASARFAWLVAILLLGNIAMAAFCSRELMRISTSSELPQVLTARHSGASILGVFLAALGVAVIGLAIGVP